MLAIAAATVGLSSAAYANGTTGTYQLCSRGTYASVVIFPERGNASTFVANPGQCVPMYMDGTRADIYGLYPGGSRFYVGTDWYQANIATTGNMGAWGWYAF